MRIGADVQGLLGENERVTIPAGKTLRIQSQSFSMASGSYIILEAGAKLFVEGKITGSGTIDVTASGAELNVVATDGIDSTITVSRP